MSRRVVVTGLGMVSPLGIGVERNWQAIYSGRSGIDTITRFDVTNFPIKIAGEVKGFQASDYIEHKEVKKWMFSFIMLLLLVRWL